MLRGSIELFGKNSRDKQAGIHYSPSTCITLQVVNHIKIVSEDWNITILP